MITDKYERSTLSDRSYIRRTSAAGRRLTAIYSLIGLVVLGALSCAAAEFFDGWHHLIVIADLIVVMLGIAVWVYPERKRVY